MTLTADQARAILAGRRKASRGQRISAAKRHERALATFRRVKEMSANGVSYRDAAEAVGLTEEGLSSMLYREAGSTAWPIKG